MARFDRGDRVRVSVTALFVSGTGARGEAGTVREGPRVVSPLSGHSPLIPNRPILVLYDVEIDSSGQVVIVEEQDLQFLDR